MASGAPIIASDIAAFKEILKHEITGLFFKKSDPQDLSKALVRLASDKNLRRRLSENARRAVQPYDWQNVANKYLELYRNLVN
jgi:phosphatidylinositol alpha-mannosyltransferase